METSKSKYYNATLSKLEDFLSIAKYERRRLLETVDRWSDNIIATTEQEKYRVIKDLHEGINQTLYAAKLMLQSIIFDLEDQKIPAAVSSKLIQAQRLLDDTVGEVKKTTKFLRPELYTQVSIVSEIHNITYEFSKRNEMQCFFTTNDFHKVMDSKYEFLLYRIVEEALLNIEEHSEAKAIDVSLLFQNSHIELRISDNGKGFNVGEVLANAEKREQNGLNSIKERVNIVNGNCEIISSPGTGTEIQAMIPINNFILDETSFKIRSD